MLTSSVIIKVRTDEHNENVMTNEYLNPSCLYIVYIYNMKGEDDPNINI